MHRDDGISATEPDWSRETKPFWAWDPGRSLILSLRAYQRAKRFPQPVRAVCFAVAIFRHRLWSVIAAADIPLNTRVGGGLMLPHPNGVVIHPDVQIGPNCLIFQQVTLGATNHGTPRIGGHVDIGAGAKVIGPVQVNDHCLVGANAVVVTDMPESHTAVGVPARVFPQSREK
jgi:serine O-acetyltransferase